MTFPNCRLHLCPKCWREACDALRLVPTVSGGFGLRPGWKRGEPFSRPYFEFDVQFAPPENQPPPLTLTASEIFCAIENLSPAERQEALRAAAMIYLKTPITI